MEQRRPKTTNNGVKSRAEDYANFKDLFETGVGVVARRESHANVRQQLVAQRVRAEENERRRRRTNTRNALAMHKEERNRRNKAYQLN
jgi:hypothetical protein